METSIKRAQMGIIKKKKMTTVPVNDFVKRFVGDTQVEGCNITHSWNTDENTENLNRQ